MAGFFIPSFGGQGGGGANPNPDAFTGGRFEPATNELVLTAPSGVSIRIPLADITPNAIQGVINRVEIDNANKQLIVETVDGQQTQFPLSQVLNGTDVVFTPTANINSNTVSGAIVEVDNKIGNAYVDANFNAGNGELTLITQSGQNNKILQLAVPFNGVREFSYNPVTQVIDVVDHTNNPVQVDLSIFATEVNGKQVVDGSVTVVAGDIGYDGQASNIQATDVQGAIDELKSDMALLDNSDIFIVPNEAEMNVLLQTPNALKKGDLIYIIDSTNVVDFDNQDVSNNGKPVAMIYDDTVANNKLRVFSKIDSPINITASNVAFAPTQHVTSANVQDAIIEVDNKTITAGTLVGTNLELEKVDGSKVNVDVTRLVGINTINTETPDAQGNIDLALEINVDNLEFKVKDNVKSTLELYTDADANTLIQYFV